MAAIHSSELAIKLQSKHLSLLIFVHFVTSNSPVKFDGLPNYLRSVVKTRYPNMGKGKIRPKLTKANSREERGRAVVRPQIPPINPLA